MTRTWVAGRRSGRSTFFLAALSGLLVVAFVVAGCGDTSTPSSASPAAVAASPDASGGAGPQPTPWPGNAVFGIEALGAADGPILAAINDLNKGIATEDLALMRRAADGLAGLDVLLPNLDKIGVYEPMRPFADKYGAALRGIVAAAKNVRNAIDAKDAGAITTTSQALIRSLGAYTEVQPELATWVEDSIKQRRLLVR